MRKGNAFRLRLILFLIISITPIIAYYNYSLALKYSNGENVSKQSLLNYFSKENKVILTPDFKRFLARETGTNNMESMTTKKYKMIFDASGMIENLNNKIKLRKALLFTGIPLSIIFSAFGLFILPMFIKAAKKRNKARIESEKKEIENTKREQKQAELKVILKREEEQRLNTEKDRLTEKQRQRGIELKENLETSEYNIYYTGLLSDQMNGDRIKTIIQVLIKYLNKDLCEGTRRTIKAKIEELEKERKKQEIISIAKADIAKQMQQSNEIIEAKQQLEKHPEDFNY